MDRPLRRVRDCRTARIKPAGTDRFVVLVDPLADKSPFISAAESFDVGGKTSRHHHRHAHEMFCVLSHGNAHRNGETFGMETGSTLMPPPGVDQEIGSVGSDKLYCLTVRAPNEGFAETIRDGEAMSLDAADRAVVSA
jgi:mannose-6-phosphate isomerase-like protein (cupin superfamily)